MATRVLIVDDDPLLREALSTALVAAGFEVATAHDGETALSQAAKFRPNIVLLDVLMPEQDGYLVCAKLKLSPAAPKVAIITGLPPGECDRYADFVHADAVLHKPAGLATIVDLIDTLLEVQIEHARFSSDETKIG